jgi:hypothetical protein
MSDFVGTVLFIILVGVVFMFGEAYGHDRLRLDIIETCIDRNPDMSNSKIRTYCRDQFDSLLKVDK